MRGIGKMWRLDECQRSLEGSLGGGQGRAVNGSVSRGDGKGIREIWRQKKLEIKGLLEEDSQTK